MSSHYSTEVSRSLDQPSSTPKKRSVAVNKVVKWTAIINRDLNGCIALVISKEAMRDLKGRRDYP